MLSDKGFKTCSKTWRGCIKELIVVTDNLKYVPLRPMYNDMHVQSFVVAVYELPGMEGLQRVLSCISSAFMWNDRLYCYNYDKSHSSGVECEEGRLKL